MSKLFLIALGGNALIKADEVGTIHEQIKNIQNTCNELIDLIKEGHKIVITHGNGPQVGNILLQNEAGSIIYNVPSMPLDVCVAFSQGFIGYIIEQQLKNLLIKNKIEREIVSLITQVLVDKNDPAFKNPTKPIGPYYTEEKAKEIMSITGSFFKEDPRGRGWRKVVPSPKPIDILNKNIIKKIVEEGTIVIAVGGGGIPVFYDDDGYLKGIEAVIDKDLASALLASKINADEFIILTDVPKVYLNYNKPNQKALDYLTIKEAQIYLEEGHFSEGSMKPKVEACIKFLSNGGKFAKITSIEAFKNSNEGTIFVKA